LQPESGIAVICNALKTNKMRAGFERPQNVSTEAKNRADRPVKLDFFWRKDYQKTILIALLRMVFSRETLSQN